MKRVFVCLNSSGVAQRDFLCGIYRHLQGMDQWDIHLNTHPFRLTPDTYQSNTRYADGAIICETDVPDLAAIIRNTTIPLVIYGTPDKTIHSKQDIAFVTSDDSNIGVVGARHLMSLGKFRQYLFIPDPYNETWSLNRQTGYLQELQKHGISADTFNWQNTSLSKDALGKWIASYPHPTAIMTAEDPLAIETISACRAIGLSVPQDVAVIGVNDDAMLCRICEPQITSIATNHEEEGCQAAKFLTTLMRRRRRLRKTIVFTCQDVRIVARGSSSFVPPAGHVVQEALSYIRENAAHSITVHDVARHLGVSRRLLDLRFRQLENQTVNETIINARLDEIKRLLTQTTLPIGKIARACQFTNLPYLATLFKRRFADTMGSYRTQTWRSEDQQ